MAKIAFSRPEGRVEVHYPDAMSLDALEETLVARIAFCRLAQSTPTKPPETGREKSTL